MATSSNTPEQGRPPENGVSLSRKYGVERKSSDITYADETSSLPPTSINTFTHIANNINNSENLYDSNYNVGNNYLNSAETNSSKLLKESVDVGSSFSNNQVPLRRTSSVSSPKPVYKSPKLGSCKETIRKVFFATKRVPASKVENGITNVPINSNINNNNNNQILTVSAAVEHTNNRAKLRNSFHQDVEEALSSLLWQPYEYQNKPNASLSSSSSCSSLSSSSGLECTNNGARSGNAATDLHLLVNNLQDRLSQSSHALRSRDVAQPRPRTYLPHRLVSPPEHLTSARHAAAFRNTRHTNCNEYTAATASAMRVEIQPELSNGSRIDNHGVSIIPPPGQQLINATNVPVRGHHVAASPLHHQNGALTRNAMQPTLKPTPVVRQSNLSSVNVVGLPNHPRQASVPSSTNRLTPNHSRNTSEPFRGLIPNHPRNASESATTQLNRAPISNANIVSILNHQRHTTNLSNIDSTNAHMVNHLRSSSVPKILPQQNAASINAQNLVHHHQRNGSADVNARSSNNTGRGVAPMNVSNVNVNYYRAVPVNVVSTVPTIQCLNTTSDSNNVSNVNIVQAMPLTSIPGNTFSINSIPLVPTLSNSTQTTSTATCTEVIVHSSHDPVRVVPPQITQALINQIPRPSAPARTFTSTEAQTDEPVTNLPAVADNINREQRRRERRERRHQRRINSANHRHVNDPQPYPQNERLPDLLNSTMPPPYSTMPGHGGNVPQPMIPQLVVPQMIQAQPVGPGNILVPAGTIVQSMVTNNHVVSGGLVPGTHLVPFHHQQVITAAGQVPLVQGAGPVPVPVPSPTGFRFPFPAAGFRRSRYSEEPPKSCCGLLAWRPGSLRWFIALIALVAVCCVLVGTALGAMRPAGRDHLTVSLLMIGVGIILVTVSGVAWRLTSHDSSTCRSMLGLGSTESVEVCARRFVPRLPPSYGRPHHPYAAMMYPEFQYRPPPPSYQASMQEYRLRLLLLDRGNTPQIQAGVQNTVSPPPTYRSHAGSLLRAPLSNRRETGHSEYSCPPSYRSQNSTRPGTILQNNSIIHSREHSLSLSESNGGSVVNVVNILSTNDEDIALDNITLDSLKLEPEHDMNPLRMLLKGGSNELDGTKDGNLVTIVQTSDQSPVIVTVSGGSHTDNTGNTVQITELPSEMEILAHL